MQAAYNARVARNTAATAANTPSLNALVGGTVTINPVTGLPNFRFPFSQTFRYSKALPNAGATYRLAEDHLVYVTYAKGFSAPQDRRPLHQPRRTWCSPRPAPTTRLGYRYQTAMRSRRR